MTTVTIPRELTDRSDLVAVPRDEYAKFIAWQKKLKSGKTFSPTASEKKLLADARKRRRRGNYLTFDELHRTLATAR
jgi:hypothetical protein